MSPIFQKAKSYLEHHLGHCPGNGLQFRFGEVLTGKILHNAKE